MEPDRPAAGGRSGSPQARRRHDLGARGEELAATWLAERGYGIVARNWTIHGDIRGEIDLVVRDGDVLAFVEVKTRRSQRFGGPLGAVRHAKQGQLRRLASAFLRDWDGYSPHLRFDVVAIIAPPGREPFVRHVTNAF